MKCRRGSVNRDGRRDPRSSWKVVLSFPDRSGARRESANPLLGDRSGRIKDQLRPPCFLEYAEDPSCTRWECSIASPYACAKSELHWSVSIVAALGFASTVKRTS